MPALTPFQLLFVSAVLVGLFLLLEGLVSFRNEHRLRARGAVEPPDDVWPVMAAAYPAAFVSMLAEGFARGGPPPAVFLIGLAAWTLAKALKFWAIASLGERWSFRVLVLPDAPLVTSGPYRRLRHPNYLAVAGELIGAAVMTAAPVAGVIFTIAFVEIMRRRMRVEERALGIRRS